MAGQHKNGAAAVRAIEIAREPLDRVLHIGDHAWQTMSAALLVALLFHGTATARAMLKSPELFNWARSIQNRTIMSLADTIDIETEKPKPPPPPEPPVEDKPLAPTEPLPPTLKDVPPPAPPEAANAGKVLTSEPDPAAPVDFTGGFVSGTGDSFVGGTTQVGGKGTRPVYNPSARATGVPNGTGAPAVVPPGPDRSRAAGRAGSDEWRCDFPPEADADQIDEAYVTLQVLVGADGHAKRVTIVQDPGHGFGRMANQCAQRETYQAQLDHDGRPVEGQTRPFRVHFVR